LTQKLLAFVLPASKICFVASRKGKNGHPEGRKRYERKVLSDAERCTAQTSRGPRCTLRRWRSSPFCSQHHPNNTERLRKARRRGLEKQRKTLQRNEAPAQVPAELLEHAKRPPRSTADLLQTLSWASSALLAGQISKSEAETVLDICKFQARLLDKAEGGEDRATLLALAGLSEEEAAGMSEEELLARARNAMGNPLTGPPS
jgi:hypothetical protein